jgi:DNA invertase Pin-like site-specific DNA recombinase
MTPRLLQRRYIPYYRVSTARQGRSGLGLASQKAIVCEFLKQSGGTVQAEFTEVQSGKDDRRPKLAEALKLCRLTNSTLLIAKLDRLSRNAAFLLTLQESGARFVACDMPDMNETVVGILAVIAQAERKAISERTKGALAAAKARGIKLGGPKLQPGTKASARRASKAAQVIAKERAEELREVIDAARKQGCESLRDYAAHLNDLGIATPRGGQWAAASVSRLIAQLTD